jgi:hypothetical protein
MSTAILIRINLLTLLLLSLGAAGQMIAIPQQIKLFTLTESSTSFGYHNTGQQASSLDQFRVLLGTSEIFSEIPTGLEQQESWFTFHPFQPFVYSTALHFRIADSKRESYRRAPQFRIGISYRGGNMLSGYFTRVTEQQIDSVMNPVTGEMDYIDSLHRSNLAFNFKSEQLFLDAAMVFTTNAEKLFSVYAGAGISAGIPITSNATIGFYDGHQRITRTSDGEKTYHESTTLTDKEDVMPGSHHLLLIPYVPFGINMRLGKKNPFLSQVSLFYEGRAGLYMRVLKGSDNVHNFTRHHTLGVKVRWS